MVQAASISNTDLIVEIGAGRGALTRPIVKRAGRVIAVELDPYLAGKLRHEFADKATIVAADFLTVALPTEVYSVIGNVPFARSTDVIRKLVEAANPPRDAWLVVQRELANRLCGRPFAQESLWSLRLKPYWHLEIVDRLKRTEFDPPPSVDSVFLQLSHRDRPLVRDQEAPAYSSMLEIAFRARSTVAEALSSMLSKRQIRRLAADLRFRQDDAPASLCFEQWLGIFRFLSRSAGGSLTRRR